MFYIVLGIFVLLLLDLFTKNRAEKNALCADKYKKKQWIYFLYVRNYGLAMGVLRKKKMLIYIINAISMIVLGYIFIEVYRSKDIISIIGISLVASGGLGNVINRIMKGYVIDFICLKFLKSIVINIADVYVILGGILTILSIFLG